MLLSISSRFFCYKRLLISFSLEVGRFSGHCRRLSVIIVWVLNTYNKIGASFECTVVSRAMRVDVGYGVYFAQRLRKYVLTGSSRSSIGRIGILNFRPATVEFLIVRLEFDNQFFVVIQEETLAKL